MHSSHIAITRTRTHARTHPRTPFYVSTGYKRPCTHHTHTCTRTRTRTCRDFDYRFSKLKLQVYDHDLLKDDFMYVSCHYLLRAQTPISSLVSSLLLLLLSPPVPPLSLLQLLLSFFFLHLFHSQHNNRCKASVGLEQLYGGAEIDSWFPLRTKEKKPAGEIHLKIRGQFSVCFF